MDDLENESIQIHQETIRREASIRQALRQSGLVNPPLIERALPMLGDALIRIGTSLKERSYTRLNAEDASVPAFLIML